MLAVVGPTATGKTALGVALAEAFEGEVISADSMQIYKGLDVGTAKVAPDETHGIPHHAVDILEPDELFSVADFVTLAGTLEADISARGRLPILVGGTGLYVQSFLYGVRFAAEKTPDGLREQLAAELAEKGPEAMYKELQTADPEAAAAIHPNNQVRVLRALEHFRATGKRLSEQKAQSLPPERPYRSLVLGLDFPDRAQLYRRIDLRVDKMLDADGIVFSTPIFEKGATGLFHTITDRFGPRMDRGNNIIGTKIAEETGGTAPDPRILKDKVISFMSVGGSDWVTRTQCDAGMLALTPMWKVIDNEVFPWALSILVEDERVARAHQIGRNIAEAAKDIEHAQYQGDAGVCPHCHSRNFHLQDGKAICCLCGLEGEIHNAGGKYSFTFPAEQLEHAHDTLSGKFIHGNDIKENTGKKIANMQTEKYKARQAAYRAFITATVPEKG